MRRKIARTSSGLGEARAGFFRRLPGRISSGFLELLQYIAMETVCNFIMAMFSAL